MGDPIIIWPPDGTEGTDPGARQEVCNEMGGGFVDCTDMYFWEYPPGYIECCPAF